MNATFKQLTQDKITFWSFLLSFILFLTASIYILINLSKMPPLLPLYNRMPWGYTRLGGKFEIFIPVSLLIIFYIVNIISASIVYKKAILLSRIISAVTFAIALCTCIYIIEIIQLVI